MLDTLGMRIEKVQMDSGLGIVAFSKSIGCGHTTLSEYKYDRKLPPLRTILNICNVYNIDANWLLFGEKEEYEGQYVLNVCKRRAID